MFLCLTVKHFCINVLILELHVYLYPASEKYNLKFDGQRQKCETHEKAKESQMPLVYTLH